MLKIFKNYQSTLSLCQSVSYALHITEKPFNKITDKELKDYNHIRTILKQSIPGKTNRSQLGLFHGKLTRSSKNVSDADNRTCRWRKPNIQEAKFYSNILKRKIVLDVSTKAIKCIRKYGGFDNYILLSKAENLDSIYGEYLRTLMMKKLQDPEFDVGYVVKSRPITYHYNKQKHFFRGNDVVWYPKDIRYQDHTQDKLKFAEDLSKKEIQEIEDLRIAAENEETVSENPILKRLQEKDRVEMEKLEPYRQQALADLERMRKKKKNLVQKTIEMAQYYQNQGFSADQLGDNAVRPRKKYIKENKTLD